MAKVVLPVVEQGGAVIVRARGERQVLLVTSRRNPAYWLFPKGHIELDETSEECAVREAEEEAGIRGTVVAPAGTLSFDLDRQTYRVHYYLMTTTDEGRAEKGRRLAWYSLDDALKRLSFEELRGVLRRSWRLLDS